jgi:hypothetical protein
MNQNVSFKKGKVPRSELELPTLHFVVMDQWVDVIGEKALFSWLKMYTWCKRDEQDSEVNLWEQAKIPTSMNKIIKKLGVGRDTFYNKILKPLWNVGLIDIEEYQHSENEGLKPMNVIVYKYPQNEKALSHKPIEIIRDYNSDYHSEAKTFTKKGGRPKGKSKENESISNDDIDEALKNLEGKQGSSEIELGLFSNRTRVVPEQNYGLFSNRTMGSSQIEHNNSFNSLSNSLNKFYNLLNNLNNHYNSSSKDIESENDIVAIDHNDIKEEEENRFDIQIDPATISFLENEYSNYIVKDIVKHMRKNNINSFTPEEMKMQKRRCEIYISKNKKEIGEFGYFFVNGILKYAPSREVIIRENNIEKEAKARTEQKLTNDFINLFFSENGRIPTQKEIELGTIKAPRKKPEVPFYNWLES